MTILGSLSTGSHKFLTPEEKIQFHLYFLHGLWNQDETNAATEAKMQQK
jgi:hypothetical protein